MSKSPLSQTSDPDSSYLDSFSQLAGRIRAGNSFSGNERNSAFYNLSNGQFTEISYSLGLDFLDDGRGLAITDLDDDGDPDYCVTNRTAPRLRLLRNDLRTGNRWVKLRLYGDPEKNCPLDPVGAKVEMKVGSRSLFRTLYAGDSFLSQSSKWLHFGLGASGEINSVKVRWPSGHTESFAGISSGKKFIIRQGKTEAVLVQDIKTELVPSVPTIPDPVETARIRLSQPLKLPEKLKYIDTNGKFVFIDDLTKDGPVLINLWASWCAPCISELGEFGAANKRFNQAGLKVVALSVDGLSDDQKILPEKITSILEDSGYVGMAGFANERIVSVLNTLILETIYQHRDLPVPTSFLIDKGSWMTVIYKGIANVDLVFEDQSKMGLGPQVALRESSPFRGTWAGKEFKKDPISVASVYRRSGYVSDAEDYLKDFLSSHKIIPGSDPGSRKSSQLSEIHFFLGEIFAEEKKFKDSLTQFKAASHLNPSSKSMLMRKIYALAQAGNNKSAIEEALGTVKRFPNDPNALTLLGDVYYTLGQSLPASEAFTKALKVNSKTIPALRGLALIRSTAEEEGLRDGKEAVRLAEFLMSSPGASQNPDFIRILAAAHLESGDYMKSKILAEKALRMAHEQSMLSLISEIESLLILIREKGKK
mgnify:CR=1 FL=1